MHRKGSRVGRTCALLLISFLLGAAVPVFLPEWTEKAGAFIPVTACGCMAALLGLDACLLLSPLCLLLMPLLTGVLGAAAALEGERLLAAGMPPEKGRVLPLLIAVPLHFFLCVRAMGSAAKLLSLLGRRRDGGRLLLTSVLLTALGFAASAWLMLCIL